MRFSIRIMNRDHCGSIFKITKYFAPEVIICFKALLGSFLTFFVFFFYLTIISFLLETFSVCRVSVKIQVGWITFRQLTQSFHGKCLSVSGTPE